VDRDEPTPDAPRRMPAAFIGHGAPTLALDPEKGAAFAAWGAALGKPRAILVASAHWEKAPPTLGATETRPLVYDFYGFPEPLYRVRYPAPGAADLARRVESLLAPEGVAREPERGLDHGVWTPLVHLYPAADVPVLQLSLPTAWGAGRIHALGARLAPLRDEGVLMIGSGNITHNLRAVSWGGGPTPAWASEFDAWAKEALDRGDVDVLLDYRTKAPALRMTHPTEDHWLPLFFAIGAAPPRAGHVRYPVEGWELGSVSRRSVELS
jgi:4,5-DOPA dioxygenase extradiol